MEDDEEDTPLPIIANQIAIADNRHISMPLIHTRPRFQTSGYISPIRHSVHRSLGLGFLSTPSDSSDDSQALLHNLIFVPGGDSEFTSHILGTSVDPGEDDKQDERKSEESEVQVEVQIGQKLREIGDHFQHEHMQLFMQYQRNRLPMWWRLASAIYNFLFPRELIGHRGAQT